MSVPHADRDSSELPRLEPCCSGECPALWHWTSSPEYHSHLALKPSTGDTSERVSYHHREDQPGPNFAQEAELICRLLDELPIHATRIGYRYASTPAESALGKALFAVHQAWLDNKPSREEQS